MNWKLWSRGLVAAIINAVANSFVIVIVDPTKFNLFQGGARELCTVAVASGIVGAALYLKEHPDPWGDFVNRSGGNK
jgi:hypothetical protein